MLPPFLGPIGFSGEGGTCQLDNVTLEKWLEREEGHVPGRAGYRSPSPVPHAFFTVQGLRLRWFGDERPFESEA